MMHDLISLDVQLDPKITLATNYFRVLAVLLIHLLCFASSGP